MSLAVHVSTSRNGRPHIVMCTTSFPRAPNFEGFFLSNSTPDLGTAYILPALAAFQHGTIILKARQKHKANTPLHRRERIPCPPLPLLPKPTARRSYQRLESLRSPITQRSGHYHLAEEGAVQVASPLREWVSHNSGSRTI